MRVIYTSEITDAVAKMCQDANFYLSDDMKNAFEKGKAMEESDLGKSLRMNLTLVRRFFLS